MVGAGKLKAASLVWCGNRCDCYVCGDASDCCGRGEVGCRACSSEAAPKAVKGQVEEAGPRSERGLGRIAFVVLVVATVVLPTTLSAQPRVKLRASKWAAIARIRTPTGLYPEAKVAPPNSLLKWTSQIPARVTRAPSARLEHFVVAYSLQSLIPSEQEQTCSSAFAKERLQKVKFDTKSTRAYRK